MLKVLICSKIKPRKRLIFPGFPLKEIHYASVFLKERSFRYHYISPDILFVIGKILVYLNQQAVPETPAHSPGYAQWNGCCTSLWSFGHESSLQRWSLLSPWWTVNWLLYVKERRPPSKSFFPPKLAAVKQPFPRLFDTGTGLVVLLLMKLV